MSNATIDETAVPESAVPEAPVDTPEGDEVLPTKERRGKGLLELDVKNLLDRVVKEEVKVPEGKNLTPHVIVKLMIEADKLEGKISTGAVSNILKKWAEYGYAEISEKPLYFIDYTDAAREKGLSALRDEWAAIHRPKKEKPAKAPKAPKAEATATADVPEGMTVSVDGATGEATVVPKKGRAKKAAQPVAEAAPVEAPAEG